MRKIWDFHGGVHPEENKKQTCDKPSVRLGIPPQLVIPLNQHIGAPAKPICTIGQYVKKGECIAEANGFVSAAAHASSSGTVVAIEDRPIPHASGMSALCVVIETDGKDNWCALNPVRHYRELDKNALLDVIRAAGIAGMGGAGFPTAVKANPRADHHIDTLIINGTECEPYITADDVLMREKAEEIVSGIEILSYLLGKPEKVLIGIEDNKPEAIEIMLKACERTPFEVVAFPTKYPSGGEKQLIQILTGKEVPSGKLPADVGIVLQNVGTARAIYRAIEWGEPLISRYTTVVGKTLKEEKNVEALIGTPIEFVLEEHGYENKQSSRLIVGGPMMGYAIDKLEAPVIKTTNCILAPRKKELPAAEQAQPCIRCGMCSEACPASLLPQQLYWFSRAEDFEKLDSHNLFDCIECGACSFVCPSNIPLVQYYRASKGAIRKHEQEKHKAEQSRQRFEFRKIRLERAEQEKEAKRQARKLAAEKAKAEKSKPAAVAEDAATTERKAPSPEKEKAKLERALSSAESRLDRAKLSLENAKADNEDVSRINQLEARVKEAELKVSGAANKVTNFKTPSTVDQDAIKNKMTATPDAKLEKSIASLQKRLDVAKSKRDEAVNHGSPNVEALEMGVTKLETKLSQARNDLAASDSQIAIPVVEKNAAELSAAERAIAKAQQRSKERETMSELEKSQAQIASMKARLDKARARLEKAENEGDENIDAFQNSVNKLEEKLNALEQKMQH